MNEIMEQRQSGELERIGDLIGRMEQLMAGVAAAMTATNERVTRLERQLELMTPVTAGQEKALGAAIGRRAREICEMYELDEKKYTRKIGALIRGQVKLTAGARTLREIPKVEYSIYTDMVECWDDYREMKRIRREADEDMQ